MPIISPIINFTSPFLSPTKCMHNKNKKNYLNLAYYPSIVLHARVFKMSVQSISYVILVYPSLLSSLHVFFSGFFGSEIMTLFFSQQNTVSNCAKPLVLHLVITASMLSAAGVKNLILSQRLFHPVENPYITTARTTTARITTTIVPIVVSAPLLFIFAPFMIFSSSSYF